MNYFERFEIDGVEHYVTLKDRHIEVWLDDELTAYAFVTDPLEALLTYQVILDQVKGLL